MDTHQFKNPPNKIFVWTKDGCKWKHNNGVGTKSEDSSSDSPDSSRDYESFQNSPKTSPKNHTTCEDNVVSRS